MSHPYLKSTILVAALLSLGACSSWNTPSTASAGTMNSSSGASNSMAASTGVVQSVERVDADQAGIGVGAISGVVVPGRIGNQASSTSNLETDGTSSGSSGMNSGSSMSSSGQAYRITLRMNDGSQQVFATATDPQYRPGDRIQIVNGIVEHY